VEGVRWEGLGEFRTALAKLAAASQVGSQLAVQSTAAALIRQAKLNATGRPGPNVVTGRLRNSIVVLRQGREGAGWSADVGPTVIYSRRIELGFTGADSLGRNYNQPPYPYFTPAYRFVMTVVAPGLYREAWRKALGLPGGG
jgi:hypothetical protein